MKGFCFANSEAAMARASSSVFAVPAASSSWVRLSTQRSRYSAWIAVAGGNSGVTALLSFLWKRPQPVARVNVSTSAAGAKYFMMSVCRLVVEDLSSDRERIFLVSLRQFLVKDASA